MSKAKHALKKSLALTLSLILVLTLGVSAIPQQALAVSPINFECPNFEAAVRELDGVPNTGNIYPSHVASVTVLSAGNISSLAGIEHFVALTELLVFGNQLSNIDLRNNTALRVLWAEGSNRLTALDVSNNSALTVLHVGSNQLTTLDVSNNSALTWLDVNSNQLTTLDVSNNSALTVLHVGGNQLTTLDVSNNTALRTLIADHNELTSVILHPTAPFLSIGVPFNNLPNTSAIINGGRFSWDEEINYCCCRNVTPFRFSPQRPRAEPLPPPPTPSPPPPPEQPQGQPWQPATPAAQLPSADSRNHWAAGATGGGNYIGWAVANGITTGTTATTFSPGSNVTRAQFVTFLHRMAGSPGGYTMPALRDLPRNEAFRNAIAWAYATGVTRGTADGRFLPNDYITRQQMATMLYRWKPNAETAPADAIDRFVDRGDVGNAFVGGIRWAAHNEIMGAGMDTLTPRNNATRSHTVAMLYRVVREFNIPAP